jgi:hypothetical protein
MATDPPGDLTLAPLNGEAQPLSGWLLTFHLALVALDPYTRESAWLIDTAWRILETFREADCRVCFLVTGTADEAREFLGPFAEKLLVFADPDRTAVKALGLNELPAFVHLRQNGSIAGAAEGWDPEEWRAVAEGLAGAMRWSRPPIPLPGDPLPYAGSPAAG